MEPRDLPTEPGRPARPAVPTPSRRRRSLLGLAVLGLLLATAATALPDPVRAGPWRVVVADAAPPGHGGASAGPRGVLATADRGALRRARPELLLRAGCGGATGTPGARVEGVTVELPRAAAGERARLHWRFRPSGAVLVTEAALWLPGEAPITALEPPDAARVAAALLASERVVVRPVRPLAWRPLVFDARGARAALAALPCGGTASAAGAGEGAAVRAAR